jgi:hypothetical protein
MAQEAKRPRNRRNKASSSVLLVRPTIRLTVGLAVSQHQEFGHGVERALMTVGAAAVAGAGAVVGGWGRETGERARRFESSILEAVVGQVALSDRYSSSVTSWCPHRRGRATPSRRRSSSRAVDWPDADAGSRHYRPD